MTRHLLSPLLILMLAPMVAQAEIPAGFELVWSDEFDYAGAPDPDKWSYEIGGGGWGNNEVQVYTDSLDNSRVEDGRLIIEVQQQTGGRVPGYTSARLITREMGQWKYGRMEIRAKMPKTTGVWPAIWMLAADTLHSTALWPDNGEIDIMEAVGYEADPLFKALANNPTLPNIHGTVHTELRNGSIGNQLGGSRFLETAYDEFHVYAINWYDDRIEWEVDGVVYYTFMKSFVVSTRNPPDDFSDAWPFDQRFFMILNVAVGGNWGGHFNTNIYPSDSPYGTSGIDHEGEWPQRMEVDYVRVYQAPTEVERSNVPGTIIASEMDDSVGILVETALNNESPHNLSRIDAGDSATFALNVTQAGTYEVTASVAALGSGSLLSWGTSSKGTIGTDISLPETGAWQTWQTVSLGTIDLPAGEDTLLITTSTGAFNLAWIQLTGESGQTWKGYPVDGSGNVNTNSWLGWINVLESPWLFSYSLNNWIYSPVALEDEFHTDSQWMYVLKP
jgi:beta-glucanase (GH16 family)